MSFETHRHVRNGLGARDEYGRMVCAICGRGYDEQAQSAETRDASADQNRPVLPDRDTLQPIDTV